MRLQLHELHHNLGFLLHQQGDFHGAIEYYRQALTHCPTDARSHYALGVVLAEQQQYPASIAHYQQAIALNPDYGRAYNNLGCVFLLLEQPEQAIQMFQQGIQRQPDLADLHNNLGQVLFDRDREAAIRAFRLAVELQPDFTLAHCNLGKLLQQYGHHKEALQHFQQALAIDTDQPEVWSDSVASWLTLGQIEEALTGLHRLLQINWHQVEAYSQWALQLRDRDDLTRAHQAAAQFFQALRSASPEAVVCLGQVYFYLGSTLLAYGGKPQFDRAAAYLQKAIRLQPQQLEAYLKLAECLTRQKRSAAALLICDAAEMLVQDVPQIASRIASQRSRIEQELQPAEQDQGRVAGIVSVQDWLDRQRAASDNRGEPAIDRCVSWADSLPFAPSEPANLAAPRAPDHSPCEGINCPVCLKQTTAAFQPHYLSRSLFRLAGAGHAVPSAPRFTARIPNGRVWAAPQQNRWLVCNGIAVFTPDQYLLSDLSRSYPIELPCSPHIAADRHTLFSQTSLPPIESIQGQVAVLTGLSGNNYFHWMVDLLPRFEILRRSGLDFAEIDWFYLNSPRAAFQQATLQKLGIPLDRLLSSDQHPHIQADQLIVPAFTGYFGWLQPWMLEFLRREFLPLASVRSPIGDRFPERIYISRTGANHRRVLNEAAVLELLHPFGFVSVELEQFSFADQIALFARAKVIVAPHGGGLTNLIFCSPGTVLLECFSPHYVRQYYWVVSQLLDLTHFCLMAEPIQGYLLRELMYASPLTADLWLDLDRLRSSLKQMGL